VTPEPERIVAMLNKIREIHGISTTEKDPIFAIITANEIAFEDHLAKIDIQNMQFYAKLASFTKEIQDEAKNLAEVRISRAVNGAFERLDDYKKEIEEVKATPSSEEQKKNGVDLGKMMWYVFGVFASACLGFGLGLLIL
jgi:hypothetical protein